MQLVAESAIAPRASLSMPPMVADKLHSAFALFVGRFVHMVRKAGSA